MEQVVDQLYFTREGQTLTIDTLNMPTNGYLLQAYKQTFLSDNLIASLSHFFNERPAESCPAMYKLLILTLASPHLSTENFKQLLSEISEVLVCILR